MLLLLLTATNPTDSVAVTPEVSAPKVHCQIPCGIYSDKTRIDLIMEDTATIAKGMTKLAELAKASPTNYNQVVRWVKNKDEHADNIQKMVMTYWLAQRIKAPKDASDAAAMARYQKQLVLLHGITVASMKCKQTTDLKWPAKLKQLTFEFSENYFTKKDLEHLKKHRDHDHK